MFYQHGSTVNKKFIAYAKCAIRIDSGARYGIRASVDLETSYNQLSPRQLGSAALILERSKSFLGQCAMHGDPVDSVKEEEGMLYRQYEVAVSLS